MKLSVLKNHDHGNIDDGISHNGLDDIEEMHNAETNHGTNLPDSDKEQHRISAGGVSSITTDTCSEDELVAFLPATSESSKSVEIAREQTHLDMNSLAINKVLTSELRQFIVLTGQIHKSAILNGNHSFDLCLSSCKVTTPSRMPQKTCYV